MNPPTIRTSFPPVAEADLDQLERDTGLTLPAAYRAFLLRNNGGTPTPARYATVDGKIESGVQTFLPLADIDDDNLREEIDGITLAEQIPANLIPIAVTYADDRVVLSVDGEDRGKVYHWAWGEEPDEPTCSYRYMRLVADDFAAFLTSLRE